MYKNLTDLPVQINETNKSTLSPLHMALDLLEKMQNSEWYAAHCDQSKNTVDNIKSMMEILTDGRITFIK